MPRRLLLSILLAASALPAAAQTSDPPDRTAELLARLQALPGVVRSADGVVWQAGDQVFAPIGGEVGGEPWVETALGGILVDRALFGSGAPGAAAALGELVEVATRGGVLPAAGVAGRLSNDPLAGHVLSLPPDGSAAIVCREGVLRRAEVAPAGPVSRVERVRAAVAAFEAELGECELDGLGRDSVRHVLARLAERDSPDAAEDELRPAFARRLVRHGWLRRTTPLGGFDSVAELEASVAEASRPLAEVEHRGGTTSLVQLRDAFGTASRVLRTPAAVLVAVAPPRPMKFFGLVQGMADSTVVAEFDPGIDPAGGLDLEDLRSAKLVHASGDLARWTPEGGLVADPGRWSAAFLGAADPTARRFARGWFPPHVPVVDLEGDLVALLAARGALGPPRGEVESFLERASRILPDAPSLDLLGHYVFVYVYDSPDTTRPGLVGNRNQKGEIHQTSGETIANASGGQCRGDCDDLAELYFDLARRQGRLAHVIGLPGHAATAWAEQREDGWHVFVLQTGPALEFVAPELPDAIEAAFERFDRSATFDPANLTIQLRFEGENTRSRWNLSWRIFADRRYADTMVDVQRDWHFHTYLQGVRKMERLIATGDDDPSNYREIASLHSFTGRHAESCTFLERAIERTTDPASRLYLTADLAARRLQAGRRKEAREAAERVLGADLPAAIAARRLEGLGIQRFGIEFAADLVRGDALDLAARALDEVAREEIARLATALARYLAGGHFDEKTWAARRDQRALLRSYTAVVVDLLGRSGPETLPSDARLVRLVAPVQAWIDGVAMWDLQNRDDAGERYALLGRFYEAMLGRDPFAAHLARCAGPTGKDHDPRRRATGPTQFELDLPWIRSSPAYWNRTLAHRLSPGSPAADPVAIHELAGSLDAAVASVRELGLETPRVQRYALYARVADAALRGDEPALRTGLAQVRSRGDRSVREETARWIGLTARSVPVARLERAVRLWHEEVASRPEILRIAWRAAVDGSPRHAVAAARVAAECHPDDRAFAEEYGYMRELFGE